MPQVAMGSEDRPNNHRERISTSLTFRLDQDNVKKLRIEAQKQGITLNPFVNQTLKSFLEWHIFEPKVGFVSVLKPVVKEVFTRISKEQVTQIAVNTGNDEVKNTVYFIKGKIDLDSFR